MKLLIALALAAAPSGLAMAPYVTITDEPTVSPIGPDPSPTNSPTKSPVTPSQAPTKAPVASTPTGDFNGCGEACDVVTIKEFPDFMFTIESDKCYEVEGTDTESFIVVPNGVNCAKITVPKGSSVGGIFFAHIPRPFLNRARETMRRGARRSVPARTPTSSSMARSTSWKKMENLEKRA